MNTIIIPTTQNIELEYPVAGLLTRFLAALIDMVVIVAYLWFWYWIMNKYFTEGFLSKAISFDEAYYTQQTILILMMMPVTFYSVICEVFFNGQTLGKRILNIRSIRLDGAAPTISQYALRWAMRLIDIWLSTAILLPGLVGVVVMLVNKKGQRLGDLLAGTTVIKLKLVTTFMDTIFVDTAENYELKFPQITKLRDRDVSILKEVLDVGIKNQNPELLIKLARKVQAVTGIETKMGARQFLETVMQDYNHYYGRE